MGLPGKAWWSGFALAVIGGLTVEVLKGFPALRFVGSGLAPALRWLRADAGLSRWAVMLLTLALLYLAVGAARRWLGQSNLPPWLGYQQDRFLGADWRWEYTGRQIHLGSLTPYCPQCRVQMVYVNSSVYRVNVRTTLLCQDCGYKVEHNGEPSDIIGLVARHIERS